MFRLLALALALVAVQGFQVTPGMVSARNQLASSPKMQFGTGNYDETNAKGFVFSPIASPSSEYGEARYEESSGGTFHLCPPRARSENALQCQP